MSERIDPNWSNLSDHPNDTAEIPASHGNRGAEWCKPGEKFSTFDLTSSRQCSRRQPAINFGEDASFYKPYMERLPRQQEYKPRPILLTEQSSKQEAVRLKRPERWQNNDWILHVGNARPHTAHVVLQFLAKHSTIQIPHPPYSPDLAPNDFFLYPKLKMNLKGRKFDNVDMIQAESKATLRNLSKSDFISCFDNWKKRWNGCIEAGGAYFEKY
ncbi:hypothetical protein LAZ67_18001757 [Cordylochernes scorpioides]|uniref:Transposase n=1 Tax=Cordylochernes scorpioides TaxID=51811 RepID=A0ABY6LG24_9ARAC|nr:hypothetical protein LAZ67_18001757 [Cordylochernes scorpioides]